MNRMYSGAEITVRYLELHGIQSIAGIPGGAVLPLYDALSRSSTIRHVLARHEQGAGFIAQGMARASGKPAVCLASSGPGATNLLTAVADAKMDSVPLIAITGQVPQALIGTDAFQEVDIVAMARPMLKAAWQAHSAAELLDILPKAFQVAASGRPGPVLIDIPKDVQLERIDVEHWPEPLALEAPAPVDEQAINRIADLINRARRPVLYLGGGIIHSGAAELARRLAETAALPTTQTLMALGAVPSDHPLSIGMLGMHAARFTHYVLDECDLLIAVGARFDDRAIGKAQAFCPHALIVHIDIDERELGKNKPVAVGVRADARAALAALLPHIQARPRLDWLDRVATLKRDFPLRLPGCDDPRRHYGLIRCVSNRAPSDTIVTTDVGQHQMWVAQAYGFKAPRRWLTSGGLGTMGFGLPAAIGAALACPTATIVCFTGDGSLLMNVQELATLAELELNVKIVLMNNGGLGLVHQQQTLFYAKRLFASRYQHAPDFVGLARGFGLSAWDLGESDEPRHGLAAALSEYGPCLIHAPIDVQEKVLPMVPPGAANREMIDE